MASGATATALSQCGAGSRAHLRWGAVGLGAGRRTFAATTARPGRRQAALRGRSEGDAAATTSAVSASAAAAFGASGDGSPLLSMRRGNGTMGSSWGRAGPSLAPAALSPAASTAAAAAGQGGLWANVVFRAMFIAWLSAQFLKVRRAIHTHIPLARTSTGLPFVEKAFLATDSQLFRSFVRSFAFFFSQIGTSYLTSRRWDWRPLFDSGGMPSSHSALCMGVTTAVACLHGVSSSLFPICLGFSAIVMYVALARACV